MKKLLKIFVGLVLLGVIAVVVIGMFLGPIVTKAVNTIGPKVTGTTVTLDEAKISPLTGVGTLKGLFVGNPAGWTGDKALYLGEVRASVQPLSLLGSHIVVNEVFIDGPEFVFENKLLGGSNIDALLAQIEANMGTGKPAVTPSAEASAEPIKFAVKSLRIQNARVTLVAAGQSITVPLPPLTLTDLGVAEGGITPDQVATQVLRNVLGQMGTASAAALKGVGGAALDGGKEGAKAAGEALKGGLNKLLGK